MSGKHLLLLTVTHTSCQKSKHAFFYYYYFFYITFISGHFKKMCLFSSQIQSWSILSVLNISVIKDHIHRTLHSNLVTLITIIITPPPRFLMLIHDLMLMKMRRIRFWFPLIILKHSTWYLQWIIMTDSHILHERTDRVPRGAAQLLPMASCVHVAYYYENEVRWIFGWWCLVHRQLSVYLIRAGVWFWGCRPSQASCSLEMFLLTAYLYQ